MLALTFLLAFLVRLIALNQSLWLDEGTTARVLQQFNFFEIVTKFSPTDFHPPLYYLVMKLWTAIFGYSEIALRAPSVLFSLAAGWFVYLLGKHLKDEKTGIWAAAFFLFNPLIIYYSQEARMYLMATFFLTAALYYFLVKRYQLFNLFGFLAFVTFYGSIFFLGAIYLYLLYKKQHRELVQTLPGFLLGLIAVAPLLVQQYANSREQLALVANWRNVLGTVTLKNLLLIPLKFSIGRISWEPKTFYYAVSGLWTAFIFWITLKNLRNKLFFIFVTPIVLGLIFSFFSPLLQYFRFIYLLPLLALLLALETNRKLQRTLLLAGFITFSLIYLLIPDFHRENWKALASKVQGEVYMIPSSSDPLKYYNSTIEVKDIRELGTLAGDQITIISYTADIYGFDYQAELRERGFSQQDLQNVRRLNWETWTRGGS